MTDENPEIYPPIISSPLTQENEDVVIIKRKKGRPRKEVVENVPVDSGGQGDHQQPC